MYVGPPSRDVDLDHKFFKWQQGFRDIMNEEALILRLPVRLANRLTARLNQLEKATDKGPTLHRRRRKQGKKVDTDKAELADLMGSVWGEEAPDYDSMDEDADDLFHLVIEDDEEEEAEQPMEDDVPTTQEEEDLKEVEAMDYWRVEGKMYVFRLGQEEYHATLINLPCVVETQKLSSDSFQIYKTGNIGQALVVHDVFTSQPRPELDEEDFVDHTYAHGVTPPMHRVAHRFAKNNPVARRKVNEQHTLSLDDVKEADARMFEMKELVALKHKKMEAHAEKSTVRKNAKALANSFGQSTSTEFVYEEVIDSEPWMSVHPDDIIVVEEGSDHFVSSTKREIRKARESGYQKREAQLPSAPPVNPSVSVPAASYIPAVPSPVAPVNAFSRTQSPPGPSHSPPLGGASPPMSFGGSRQQSPVYGTSQQSPSYSSSQQSAMYGYMATGRQQSPPGSQQQSPTYGVSKLQSPSYGSSQRSPQQFSSRQQSPAVGSRQQSPPATLGGRQQSPTAGSSHQQSPPFGMPPPRQQSPPLFTSSGQQSPPLVSTQQSPPFVSSQQSPPESSVTPSLGSPPPSVDPSARMKELRNKIKMLTAQVKTLTNPVIKQKKEEQIHRYEQELAKLEQS